MRTNDKDDDENQPFYLLFIGKRVVKGAHPVVAVTMIMIKIGENDVIWPAHEVETKIPEKFPNNPGIENKGKSRPEKSRDPGIWQNPVPKIPGLKIWIPLGPGRESVEGQ